MTVNLWLQTIIPFSCEMDWVLTWSKDHQYVTSGLVFTDEQEVLHSQLSINNVESSQKALRALLGRTKISEFLLLSVPTTWFQVLTPLPMSQITEHTSSRRAMWTVTLLRFPSWWKLKPAWFNLTSKACHPCILRAGVFMIVAQYRIFGIRIDCTYVQHPWFPDNIIMSSPN